MLISSPRYVLLDTATINYAADHPHELVVRELTSLFKNGCWIPFITFHQLEEIAGHGNREVFERHFGFLGTLSQIGYLKTQSEGFTVGSTVNLRDYEIQFLADHPGASHQEVIAGVRPRVRSGLCSGTEFLRDNSAGWEVYRTHFASYRRTSLAENANLTHFLAGNPKARIPKENEPVEIRSDEEAANQFALTAQRLSERISDSGDVRGLNPETAALQLMREAYQDSRPLLSQGEKFFEAMLARDGVRRERLPRNPRVEDVGYEAVFVAQMGIHARRLLRNKDELLELVRKESVPSWFAWQEIERRLKQLPKAEIGNVNDKHIAPFGFYVDALNVDKRIADLIRQAAKTNPLLKVLHSRVPKERGISGLMAALRTPSPAR